MDWNTGFSLVTNLNKGCSFLMVLKPCVWQGVCSVVRLNTNTLIGTSVYNLERAKNTTQKPHLTLFFNWTKLSIFCGKTCSLHKIRKIFSDIVTYVFLSGPNTEKKIINIHFCNFSF